MKSIYEIQYISRLTISGTSHEDALTKAVEKGLVASECIMGVRKKK